MRENRTYGSVRGGGSNADRLLDSDMSASWGLPGAMRCIALSAVFLSFDLRHISSALQTELPGYFKTE